MYSVKKYVAAVLGGSGSVGKHVIKSLLSDTQCGKIILLSRRELVDLKSLDPAKIEVIDPIDNITSKANLSGTIVAFCTLGHESSHKATKDDLFRVDATNLHTRRPGSNETSTWNFMTKTAAGGGWYSHVKGVVERLTIEAGIPYTYIAQPATLLGSPHSPKIAEMIQNCILPMKCSDIAKGMAEETVNASQSNKKAVVNVSGGIPVAEGE